MVSPPVSGALLLCRVSCSHCVLVSTPSSLLQPAYSFVSITARCTAARASCHSLCSSCPCSLFDQWSAAYVYRCVLPLLLQSTSLRAKLSSVWVYISRIPASPMASYMSQRLALVPRHTSDSRFRGTRSRVHFAHATSSFLKC